MLLSRRSSIKSPGVVLGLVLVCVFSTAAFGQPWDGNGVEGDPYLIWDACDMQAIGADANYWDAHFVLCADINLSAYTGTQFNIIGNYPGIAFTGVFDGNGHSISNFTYVSSERDYVGIFGYVDDPNASIKDVMIVDANVDAGYRNNVGSLVGYLRYGAITGCSVEGGRVSAKYSNVGGLVGAKHDGEISNCSSTASVEGAGSVGGLVGYNSGYMYNCQSSGNVSGVASVGGLVGQNANGNISSCSSTATVSALGDYLGGLIGQNWHGEISFSYARGSVSGNGSRRVGGLVGLNYEGSIESSYSLCEVSGEYGCGGLVGMNHGSVLNCYSTGSVSCVDKYVGGLVGYHGTAGAIGNSYSTGSVMGGENVGGLVGFNYRGVIYGSYWDAEASGEANSAGGIGKMTEEMQAASTFVGWGCWEVWTIDDGNDYPRLAWEGQVGQLISDPDRSLLYAGGSGEPEDPYLIYTAEQLNTIGLYPCDWDKDFRLTNDVDLSEFVGSEFNMIGYPFTGVFDGGNHVVSNFSHASANGSYVGLFDIVPSIVGG